MTTEQAEAQQQKRDQDGFGQPTEDELRQVQYALRTYGGDYGRRLANTLPLLGERKGETERRPHQPTPPAQQP